MVALPRRSLPNPPYKQTGKLLLYKGTQQPPRYVLLPRHLHDPLRSQDGTRPLPSETQGKETSLPNGKRYSQPERRERARLAKIGTRHTEQRIIMDILINGL